MSIKITENRFNNLFYSCPYSSSLVSSTCNQQKFDSNTNNIFLNHIEFKKVIETLNETRNVCINETEANEFVYTNKLRCTPISDNVYLEEISKTGNVLIDARENRLYQAFHLQHAINLSCHTKVMVKRAICRWQQILKDNVFSSYCIYIYDDASSKLMGLSSGLQQFVSYLVNNGNQVLILDGGYKENFKYFEENYLTSTLNSDEKQRYMYSPTNNQCGSDDVLNATISKIDFDLYL
jgi:hypothetical protein